LKGRGFQPRRTALQRLTAWPGSRTLSGLRCPTTSRNLSGTPQVWTRAQD